MNKGGGNGSLIKGYEHFDLCKYKQHTRAQ